MYAHRVVWKNPSLQVLGPPFWSVKSPCCDPLIFAALETAQVGCSCFNRGNLVYFNTNQSFAIGKTWKNNQSPNLRKIYFFLATDLNSKIAGYPRLATVKPPDAWVNLSGGLELLAMPLQRCQTLLVATSYAPMSPVSVKCGD